MLRTNREPEYRRRIREKAEEDKKAADREREKSKNEYQIQDVAAALHRVEQALDRANNEHTPQKKRDRYWERFGFIGLWVAAFVGVAAIMVGTHDAEEQRTVMREQLNEMRNSSRQTDQTIAALKGQAEIMRGQLDEMQSEKRAWVGPVSAGFPDGLPDVGNPANVVVVYHNTGKEPAIDVFSDLRPYVATLEEDRRGEPLKHVNEYAKICLSEQPIIGKQVVFPTTGISSYTIGRIIDGNLIDWDILYGTNIIFITGCYAYNTLSIVHRTSFCFFFQNSPKMTPRSWSFCPVGNYAN